MYSNIMRAWAFWHQQNKNEYFVVSSEVLRQLPETYGGRYGERYGGPLSCKVGEN